MSTFEWIFFALCTLLGLLGGVITVASKNPIRGAMGLLSTIVGIAGLYLLLSAEFLAAIQLIVYAGAVVVLFLFVIMLLGPSATSQPDAKSAIPRYIGGAIFLLTSLGVLWLVYGARKAGAAAMPVSPKGFGTIESIGRQLFTEWMVPFELSGALLLVAVVGAVAVARGKQVDPTLLPADGVEAKAAGSTPAALPPKESHS